MVRRRAFGGACYVIGRSSRHGVGSVDLDRPGCRYQHWRRALRNGHMAGGGWAGGPLVAPMMAVIASGHVCAPEPDTASPRQALTIESCSWPGSLISAVLSCARPRALPTSKRTDSTPVESQLDLEADNAPRLLREVRPQASPRLPPWRSPGRPSASFLACGSDNFATRFNLPHFAG